MKIKEIEKCTPGTEVVNNETGRHGVVVRTSASSASVLVLFDGGDKEWVEYFKVEIL